MSTRFSQASTLLFLLLAPVGIGLIAWGVAILNGFQASDGLIYDRLIRWRASRIADPPRILLLEVDDGEKARFEAELPRLMEELKRLGARLLVFVAPPAHSRSEFYAAAAAVGDVIVGRPLPGGVQHELDALMPPIDDDPAAFAVTTGIVANPEAPGGISRKRAVSLDAGGVKHYYLEVAAAMHALGPDWEPPSRDYRIDFRGGPGSLPNVPAQRLLQGDLIEEVVRGRCVLVGPRPQAIGGGYHTPTTSGEQAMPPLEFQGHAFETLLSGRIIREPGASVRLAITICLLCLCVWCSRQATLQVSTWIAAGLMGCCLLGSAVALVLFRTWLPVTENVAALGMLLFVSLRGRAVGLTTSLSVLISESVGHLREKYWPVHVHDPSGTWALVANMIHQTLDLRRLIFLRANPRTARLEEIVALHCSLDDVAERRRDFNRPPYKDAVAAKGPIVVEGFLRTTDKSERQYLIPLQFSSELLGFWALGIDAAKVAIIPGFDSLLLDYTSRVSELLHHARGTTTGSAAAQPVPLDAGGSLEPSGNLRTTLSLLQQRLGALDTLVNSLDSGVIVFDIFGRILQINERMLTLFRKEDLVPFKMTALDIIMALSDFDLSKARKLLRRVIVENSQVSIPVTLRSAPDSRYLFHLKPLARSGKEDKGNQQHLGARSILCELVETTSMTTLYEMKSRLTEMLCTQLRNDLAPIDLSWSLIGLDAVAVEKRRELAESIQTKVRQAVKTVSECQQYLALDVDVEDLERFPLNPKQPLALAIEEVKASHARVGLEIQVLEPTFVSFVFASDTRLKDLFKAILGSLCQDAVESSSIIVRVTESDGIVAFDFSNLGFGIPNEVLQQNLLGEQAPTSPELQTIQSGMRWVQAWGGMLEAFSGVGVGMHFTVHLVKFL